MSKKHLRNEGADLFYEYFAKVYGDRWPRILAALKAEDLKVARVNGFYQGPPAVSEMTAEGNNFGLAGPVDGKESSGCYYLQENFSLENFATPVLPFYRMDPASILAAQALGVEKGDSVLDMCAAPGGKTLILLEALAGEGELVANEISPKRRYRLMGVIKRYVDASNRRLVTVKGIDAGRFGLSEKRFDKILLDAPCSGERGVVNKASDLAEWREKRTKNFAIRQYALLASAFLALKPGGRILYSTCSISPYENDGVIDKLFQRHPDTFSIKFPTVPRAEKTKHGWQFLPDQDGWGPIFFSVIEKSAEERIDYQ